MTLPVPCEVGERSHHQNGVCVLRARVGLGLSHHLECPSGVGSSGRQGSLTGLSGILKGATSRSLSTPLPPLLAHSTDKGPCLVWWHTCWGKASGKSCKPFLRLSSITKGPFLLLLIPKRDSLCLPLDSPSRSLQKCSTECPP